jgi:arylsulfatase A-like enzyme
VVRNGAVLAERHATLAERLREAGWATAAVVASYPLARRFGFAQGFDVYRDEFRVETPLETWEDLPLAHRRFYSLADAVTESALAVLDASRAPRQFHWVHYFDPHDPYGDSSGPGLRMELLRSLSTLGEASLPAVVARARRLYTQDLEHLDRALARLFERLDADASRYQTHVVVTSDHGESFGELRIFGHGTHLTPEQVHVPCFVVSPRVAPGARLEAAGSVDVAATVLALAGLAAPPHGHDLLPAGGGSEGAAGMVNLSLALDPLTGERVRLRPRFFLVQDGVQYTGDAEAVFLDDDPARPVQGPAAQGARRAFAGFLRDLAALGPESPLGPEEREGLRALGYLP